MDGSQSNEAAWFDTGRDSSSFVLRRQQPRVIFGSGQNSEQWVVDSGQINWQWAEQQWAVDSGRGQC
jgi:hypothetical protein